MDELGKLLQAWKPEEPLSRALADLCSAAPSPADPVVSQSAAQPPSPGHPWAALRRALARGQLAEASARQREVDAAPDEGGCPGSESLGAAERERALRLVLDGIESAMASDATGCGRALGELTAKPYPNLSIRWIAHHWSAWAALDGGNLEEALRQAKEALSVAQEIDLEARAVSVWTAAEVVSRTGDLRRAQAWLGEARELFQRLEDSWGEGRTWLTEARIRASTRRDLEADQAARAASAVDPGWDEPAIFLARRALMGNDLLAAEELLDSFATPGAEGVRALIGSIRQGAATQAAASEVVKAQDAPPSPRSMEALERIAGAFPDFVEAREALATMLLKTGRYADAGIALRGLLVRPLSPRRRAAVILGLRCVAQAELRSAAGEDANRAPPPRSDGATSPQLALPPSVALMDDASRTLFSGQLGSFAVPALLEFLRGARRTGLLVCSSSAGLAVLRFRDGRITGAASPGIPKIGEILVSAGKLSAEAVRAAAERRSDGRSGGLFGELLVREGLVEVAAVQEALRRQIELAVRELVGWKAGEFAFNHDGESASGGSKISISSDPQALLLTVFDDSNESPENAGGDADADLDLAI